MKKFYVGIKGVVREKARGIILLQSDYKSGDFWDAPGGRINGSENFEQTLKRELSEELPGISDIKIGDLLGAYRLNKDVEKDTGLVLLYFFVDAKLPKIPKLSDEHQNYMFLKRKNELPKGLNPEIKRILESLLN